MTLLHAPTMADSSAPLARRNPLAKLGAALVPAVALLVGIDVVSSDRKSVV